VACCTDTRRLESGLWPHGRQHGTGDLGLQLEDVAQLALECLRPELEAVERVDQLHVDAHRLTMLAHAAFEHGRDTQAAADFARVDVSPLEGERG
jgi:hypothetical protein